MTSYPSLIPELLSNLTYRRLESTFTIDSTSLLTRLYLCYCQALPMNLLPNLNINSSAEHQHKLVLPSISSSAETSRWIGNWKAIGSLAGIYTRLPTLK